MRLGSTQDPTLPVLDPTDLPVPPIQDPLIDPGNPLLNTPPAPTPAVAPWYVWAGLAVAAYWLLAEA